MDATHTKKNIQANQDGVVAKTATYRSTDYDKFHVLGGNRDLDLLHVKRLKKLMTENGNLTMEDPIIVNSGFEVLDGQHRLQSLKELGWPVFYQVRQNMSLDNVRAINVGKKNWSWYDFAKSYAKLGNNNYVRFVMLADMFPQFGFGVIARYAGLTDIRKNLGKSGIKYRAGEMEFNLEHFQRAKDRLNLYVEAAELLPRTSTVTAQAFYTVLQARGYDHKRMIDQLSKYAPRVFDRQYVTATMNECLRAFEEVYNFNRKDGEETRLY